MRIALVSEFDLKNKSKISYWMAEALKEQNCEIIEVRVMPPSSSWLTVKRRFYSRVVRKRYSESRDPFLVKRRALTIKRALKRVRPDIILSPYFIGSQPLAFLNTKIPYVIWSDVTFSGVIGFYPNFCNLCNETIRDGKRMENIALHKADLILYTSQWAADGAIEYYHLDKSKIKVVSFGPNLKQAPDLATAMKFVERRPKDRCKLLFLGKAYLRKGGDVAVEVVKKLNETGLPSELAIAGPVGLKEEFPEFVRQYGRIDKNTKEGEKLFNSLLQDSHFMILPTRSDCTPHAVQEANANAMPTVGSNVGGMPSLVMEDVNGMLFPLDAPITDYCSVIKRYMNNYDDYKRLALSTFHEYESRQNWKSAGAQAKFYMEEFLRSRTLK